MIFRQMGFNKQLKQINFLINNGPKRIFLRPLTKYVSVVRQWSEIGHFPPTLQARKVNFQKGGTKIILHICVKRKKKKIGKTPNGDKSLVTGIYN